MASSAQPTPTDTTPSGTTSLRAALSEALPRGSQARVRYVRSRSKRSEPLFSPLTGFRLETTHLASHFLTVSTAVASSDVLVYAVEILVYSTRRLTTLFVSKADSTGYRDQHNPTPIRNITTTFLRWLIERQIAGRPRRPLVVSLFGRAQGAYLFPGSAENSSKHVLDDRQLIKWWVKVLDPLLSSSQTRPTSDPWHGFITVPGYQGVELRQFLPVARTHWTAGTPLQDLATIRGLPEHAPTRCLLPRFPDDPKARFMQDLDDEVGLYEDAGASAVLSPSKRKDGRWKTIHSLDRFWEAMEFRQECSSGRVVGFLWLVINNSAASLDSPRENSPGTMHADAQDEDAPQSPTPTDRRRRSQKHKQLKGKIVVRPPRIKGSMSSEGSRQAFDGNGVSVTPEGYDQVMQTLLHLDFATADMAAKSTQKWINEVAMVAKLPMSVWSLDIQGNADVAVSGNATSSRERVNDLGSMIRKKKRGHDDSANQVCTNAGAEISQPAVNMLGAGLIRKKAKAV